MFIILEPTSYNVNLCDHKECVSCWGKRYCSPSASIRIKTVQHFRDVWRKNKSLPWKTAYPRGKAQEWKLAEEPPHCLNCVSAVPSLSSLSVSNLLTLCVKLKAAVNHFLPCEHGQNGHQHTQMGGMVKKRCSKRGKKTLFLSVLVILPSYETLLHLNLPPKG